MVENPDVPNEYNQEIMADTTKTIASGFQNILAGGGLQNILELFKGAKGGSSSGIGNLLKNLIVVMMVGYFISKLVNKYRLSPSSATNIANNLIPNAIHALAQNIFDPSNPNATVDRLVNSLTGAENSAPSAENQSGVGILQNLLESFTGGDGNSGGLQDLIGNIAEKARSSFQSGQAGGLMELIKSFMK
ncbi:MAG: hypothetical protein N2747_10280 [Chitinophagaceae bacterium]|nr:hypothetical protein [Chitinophagaceae bacterium]